MSEHAAHHRNYVKIWGILVGLLVISVLGPMTGIRVVMLITAFGIALVKAYMVAKNFMHLDVEKPIVHWMMAIALAFMVLLFAGVAPDVMKSQGRRWVKGPGFHPVEHPGHEVAEARGGAPGAGAFSAESAPTAHDVTKTQGAAITQTYPPGPGYPSTIDSTATSGR